MSDEHYLQTSVYLSAEDRVMMDDLMERTGLSRSALFRLALKRMFTETDTGPGDRQTRLLEIADEIRSLA